MNDIYYQLLRYGCIDKAEYIEKQSNTKDTSAIRAEYLNGLEEKNREVKDILIELHEEEVEILSEIRDMINTPEFKRGYRVNRNKTIEKYIGLLENNNIECTKGKKELKKIRKTMKDLIEKQRKIDNNELNKIKQQVGAKIWEDFQYHFQSPEFLNLINSK